MPGAAATSAQRERRPTPSPASVSDAGAAVPPSPDAAPSRPSSFAAAERTPPALSAWPGRRRLQHRAVTSLRHHRCRRRMNCSPGPFPGHAASRSPSPDEADVLPSAAETSASGAGPAGPTPAAGPVAADLPGSRGRRQRAAERHARVRRCSLRGHYTAGKRPAPTRRNREVFAGVRQPAPVERTRTRMRPAPTTPVTVRP